MKLSSSKKSMKSTKIIIRNIIISLTVLFLFCFVATITDILAKNKYEHTYKCNAVVNAKPSDVCESECYISVEIPMRSDGKENSWFESEIANETKWGAQYDIYITNNSNALFTDWSMKIILPCKFYIDSSWNGTFADVSTESENIILVEGIDSALNVDIFKGESGKIGFVLYSPYLIDNFNFEISYHLKKSIFADARVIVFFLLFLVSAIALIIYFLVNLIVDQQKKQSQKTIEALIKLISHFIDVRDPYTKEHSAHVGKYSRLIAERMGYTDDALQNIYCMGLLHDVGKVLIPGEILRKPGKLNDEEWEIMKKHTVYGSEVLKDFDHLPMAKEAVLYHHERYDGKGYMAGLKGDEIPLVARIICVADSYDAMATDRAYRKALSKDIIMSELEKNKGTQFDPQIADCMLELLKENKI